MWSLGANLVPSGTALVTPCTRKEKKCLKAGMHARRPQRVLDGLKESGRISVKPKEKSRRLFSNNTFKQVVQMCKRWNVVRKKWVTVWIHCDSLLNPTGNKYCSQGFYFFSPISYQFILKACERTPSFPGTLIRKHVAMNSKDLMGLPGLDEALHNVLLPLKFSLQERQRDFFFL